jgi:hypothetical protein
MGHHSDYVSFPVSDSCNIIEGAIGIEGILHLSVLGAIAEKNLSSFLNLIQHIIRSKETTFSVSDRYPERSAASFLLFQKYIPANKLLVPVAKENTGKQPAFTENLKAVADSEYFTSLVRELYDALHHGTKPGDRSASQVVTITEATGQNDAIFGSEHAQVAVFVPECDDIAAKIMVQSLYHVAVAIGTWKYDNSELHKRCDLMQM